MSHVPSSFVSYIQLQLELLCGDTFLGRANEIDRQKPLSEWQVAVVKDGAGGD